MGRGRPVSLIRAYNHRTFPSNCHCYTKFAMKRVHDSDKLFYCAGLEPRSGSALMPVRLCPKGDNALQQNLA